MPTNLTQTQHDSYIIRDQTSIHIIESLDAQLAPTCRRGAGTSRVGKSRLCSIYKHHPHRGEVLAIVDRACNLVRNPTRPRQTITAAAEQMTK